jgi:hypothetical protein
MFDYLLRTATQGTLVLQYQHWKWMDRAMQEAHQILEKYKQEEKSNLLPIRTAKAAGGRKPPWLTSFEVGDTFLTKHFHGATVWYDEVTICRIEDQMYYLLLVRAFMQQPTKGWADAVEYSSKFIFVKLLNRKKENG